MTTPKPLTALPFRLAKGLRALEIRRAMVE